MNSVVIDASVAIKWVVAEPGHENAVKLRGQSEFVAPDLLCPECANILWKKARRGELLDAEAELACGVLMATSIDLHPMLTLMHDALRIALALDHSVYDCTYLALAIRQEIPFVTADQKLITKVRASTLADRPVLIGLDQL